MFTPLWHFNLKHINLSPTWLLSIDTGLWYAKTKRWKQKCWKTDDCGSCCRTRQSTTCLSGTRSGLMIYSFSQPLWPNSQIKTFSEHVITTDLNLICLNRLQFFLAHLCKMVSTTVFHFSQLPNACFADQNWLLLSVEKLYSPKHVWRLSLWESSHAQLSIQLLKSLRHMHHNYHWQVIAVTSAKLYWGGGRGGFIWSSTTRPRCVCLLH